MLKEMERCCFATRKTGEKFVDNFLKKENIRKCAYQGSNNFEGNQAQELLKKCDQLEDVLSLQDYSAKVKAQPFVKI